jgi:hypothetical protein
MNAKISVMAAIAVLAMTGCGASGGTTPAGVTASQAQACRQRTDEVFLQQNRGELYRADSYVAGARDTPLSGGTVPSYAGGLGSPSYSDGLGGQYARARALNDCYKSINTGPITTGPITTGPAVPAKP